MAARNQNTVGLARAQNIQCLHVFILVAESQPPTNKRYPRLVTSSNPAINFGEKTVSKIAVKDVGHDDADGFCAGAR